MHRFALGLFALLASSAAAAAADLRIPVRTDAPLAVRPQLWSGMYIGLNAGGSLALGKSDFSVAGGPVFVSASNPLDGAIGGVQLGFNWQTDAIVFGVEADIQYSGVRGSLTAPCLPAFCGLALSATYTQKVSWFGTARARVGYASAGWLLYVTGGYAYGRVETDASATAGAVTAALNWSESRNGWTVGAGAEVELAPRWSFKLEYLHVDFGSRSNSVILTGLPVINDSTRITMDMIRAGVNVRF
jgi:outer membrane immunogenic protein